MSNFILAFLRNKILCLIAIEISSRVEGRGLNEEKGSLTKVVLERQKKMRIKIGRPLFKKFLIAPEMEWLSFGLR